VCEDCQEGLFIKVTPLDFLFTNFLSKTMRALKYAIRKTLTPNDEHLPELKRLFNTFKLDINQLPDEIALLASANTSIGDEYYTINNGRFDRNKLLNIENFLGSEKLPEEWWPRGPQRPSAYEAGFDGMCRDVFGTDGKQLNYKIRSFQ